MKKWVSMTSDEVAALDRRLPVIIPVGLVEAHGPHMPTSVDVAAAEYFAERLAKDSGAILAQGIAYGFADEMAGYPGTLGVRAETLMAVVEDLSNALCRHGFANQIFLSGHGANKAVVELAFWRIWQTHPNLRAVCWNYWTEAGLTSIHHADKGETEIAMAAGIPVKMELAREFKVVKPWYKIRSRALLDPSSGGVNGNPALADAAVGESMREQVATKLAEKVREIMKAEGL